MANSLVNSIPKQPKNPDEALLLKQPMQVRIFAYIGLLIFLYFLVYYSYIGILHPIPGLGDSWDYHIPISKSILSGQFLHLTQVKLPQWYYPGSSEIILSLFMLAHIPLTLSNIFAVVVLFFVCWKLALSFRLEYYLGLLFATTVCTLTVLVRWYNAVSIDVWVAVFFLLSIILLENPKKSWLYFLKLGFVLGMMIGSKYTALLYFLLLLFIYWKNIYKTISFSRFVVFLTPFSMFGLFWYIRNYFLTHNPFYPLTTIGFNGSVKFSDTVWVELLKHSLTMLNSIYGDYTIWIFLIPFVTLLYLWKSLKTGSKQIYGLPLLLTVSICNLLVYLISPSSKDSWVMVSSLRYSYPAFIPFILSVFLIAQNYKKQTVLGVICIASMIMTLSLTYYPKLLLLYLPLALISIYAIDRINYANK